MRILSQAPGLVVMASVTTALALGPKQAEA
jgi:hypothetical protein